MTTEAYTYLMGRSEAETRRLMAQHRLYALWPRGFAPEPWARVV